MEEERHLSKKRKTDDRSYTSSSDELGGDSDVERRRASLAKHVPRVYGTPKISTTKEQRHQQQQQQQQHQQPVGYEWSESSDELAGDHSLYWQQRKQMSNGSASSRESTSTPTGSQKAHESEVDAFEDGQSERFVDRSVRTPTPTPPPPPPKPERLNYKEKFILRGHQRGVSNVEFSPDGTMLASCCKENKTQLLQEYYVALILTNNVLYSCGRYDKGLGCLYGQTYTYI